MEPLNAPQIVFRLILALTVVAWGWYSLPLQQLITGIAGGVLLLLAVKPQSRLAACLDALSVSILQIYSPLWLPLGAWVIAVHRRYARSVALLLLPAPFLYAWRADSQFHWWAVLFGALWLYLGFTLAEHPADKEEDGLLLPLPDEIREQWEQEREAHRQLRYQYQQLVAAYRELGAQRQTELVRLQILRAAVLAHEPQEAARQILSDLCEHLGAKEGALWFFEAYDSSLKLAYAAGSHSIPARIALSLPSHQQREASSLHESLKRIQTAVHSSLSGEAQVFVLHHEQHIAGAVALFHLQGEEPVMRERFQQVRDMVALALRVSVQHHLVRQENRVMNALYEIGRLLLVSQSVEDSASKFISVVANLLSVPFVTLYLREQETGSLQVAAAVGEPVRLMEQQPDTDGGIAGWIAQQARPLYLPHASAEPRLIGTASKRVFASLIGAPLLVRGRVEGVLLAAHSTPGYFDQHHLERLTSAADQFAQVLEVWRLTRSVGLLAITDGLTGIFNRRYMEIRLDEEIHRSQRYGKRFSLILADVDHFKQMNDTWGHATGDMVLREVSRQLVENLRETEMVFRYGGEEFLIILPEVPLQQAIAIAQRLREIIQQHPFRTLDGAGSLRVTLSAGVAEYPTHGLDKSALLAAADQALYLAKQRGRNRVEHLQHAA
ncbi:MAG: sensor domain-containing diguanylate cyclase [bacterium]|nr:sensor domain-containing diguanylate cyclase [bacterium]